MSDKSESFEEWRSRSNPRFQRRLPIEEGVARKAWSYLQKKFKAAEEENKILREAVLDAIGDIKRIGVGDEFTPLIILSHALEKLENMEGE